MTRASMSKIVVFFSLVLPISGFGQDQKIRLVPSKTPPTLPVLYKHFLAYQLHLERKADELKQLGKDGEDFRTRYQRRLGFSDQEFTKVHESALHLEKVLQEKDAEAKKIIQNVRAAAPTHPLPPGWVIPPPPPRLKELQTEHDAAINAEIDTLHKSLTATDISKLETFLQKDFSKAVTVETSMPPHMSPHTPMITGARQ